MTFTDGVILFVVGIVLSLVIYFNLIKKPVGTCSACAKNARFDQKSLRSYYEKHKQD